VAIGREFADPDLVAMAVQTEGLVLLDLGRVDEGWRRWTRRWRR
jgi:hypothetical protein